MSSRLAPCLVPRVPRTGVFPGAKGLSAATARTVATELTAHGGGSGGCRGSVKMSVLSVSCRWLGRLIFLLAGIQNKWELVRGIN